MKLSVIIVSYNVKYYLEQCVRSVIRSAEHMDYEILIIDNASSDETVSYLMLRFPEWEYPQVKIIANLRNIGFGRANNMASKQAQGEFILFLNPDTILTEHTLEDCIKFADEHSNVGGVGVRMLKSNGGFALESRRGLPSPFTAFCKMSGLAAIFPKSRLFGRYYMRYLDDKEINKIDVVSGAFLMVKRSVLMQIGGFDKDFFMYGEDIDFSYRLLKMGLDNYYVPTPILHYKGESTEKSSYRYVHVFYEAMLIFFNKHYGHYSFYFSFLIRIAIYMRAIMALIKQQGENLRAMINVRTDEPDVRYLFVGSTSMLDEVKSLCERWLLQADYINMNESGIHERGHCGSSVDLSSYRYVVYDTEAFSYGDILSFFEKSQIENLSIGTYSIHTHVLLTADNIYT